MPSRRAYGTEIKKPDFCPSSIYHPVKSICCFAPAYLDKVPHVWS